MAYYTAPDGAKLHYLDEGEGLPVLALPGLTRNATDFDYLEPNLDGVRLIRPDYRGRGKSEWTGAASYTIPVEAGDVLALLDHLGLGSAAVIGTSRGGLIAMTLAALAKDRLRGVCLVDIGPEIAPAGLDVIKAYVGRNPVAKTFAEAAAARAKAMPGFRGVSAERWDEEVRKFFTETPEGLRITYDPALRDAVLAPPPGPLPDLWPLFDAFAGLPLALIRGANSDLLSKATADEMSRRRPDMIRADIADRGHVPFLDEPDALAVIWTWLGAIE